jgi:multidrug resistance efflux pump
MESENEILETQNRQNLRPNIIGWVIGLVAIAVVYLVFNLVFVGGQKLWHSGDQKKLDQIKAVLETEKNAIDDVEAQLVVKNINMDKLKKDIDALKNSRDIDRYNRLVDDYNMKLGAYNQQYDDYEKRLNSYNQKVNEANELAKKIGSTWYVIPVPVGKH